MLIYDFAKLKLEKELIRRFMLGIYRTFLALLVVLLHLGGIPKIGAYAVFGFYCLSGFLMTLIMHSTYGYHKSGFCKYLANRFLRIFPLYWLSVLLSLCLIYFLGSSFTSSYHPAIYFPSSFSEVFENIFLFFPNREIPRLTPPSWALTVELFYYILIGLGLSRTKLISLVWLFLSIIYHVIALVFDFGWEYRYFSIAAASLPFSAGACIYHYRIQFAYLLDSCSPKREWVPPLSIYLLLLLNWFFGYCWGYSETLFFYTNFLLCVLAVPIMFRLRSLPYFSRKLDKIIGDLSYPIYLIHYQVGLATIIALNIFGVSAVRPSLQLLFISLPFIILFSSVISVAVESPIDMFREKIKRNSKNF